MFKRVLQFGLGIIAAGALAGAVNVSAASDGSVVATKDKTAPTQANIKLTAGGPVTLDSAPSYDFGSVPLKSDGNTVAHFDGSNETTPLQVTNPGNADGWLVNVSLGNFYNADKSLKISGATLSLTSMSDQFQGLGVLANTSKYGYGVATTTNNTSIISNDPTKSTGGIVHGATLDAGVDDAQGIFYADCNQGIGIWQTAFDADLTIPAGNVEGSYTADLDWTVVNAPSN